MKSLINREVEEKIRNAIRDLEQELDIEGLTGNGEKFPTWKKLIYHVYDKIESLTPTV